MTSHVTRRLSVPELSQKILEMAKTGVYRESIFEALHPLSTKKNIRLAITHAKHFGLHSVAELRDDSLGTYYQVDLSRYQAHHHLINHFTDPALIPDDPVQSLQTTQNLLKTVRRMVYLSMGSAIALGILGSGCVWMELKLTGGALWLSAVTLAGIGQLQWRMVASFFNKH
ncbi:MAG: hypothetical protein F6K09_29910 [Merismopedia sp. SIO2A8]|nr:hypothetical protein [Merismopedia sp. SIO2A8]